MSSYSFERIIPKSGVKRGGCSAAWIEFVGESILQVGYPAFGPVYHRRVILAGSFLALLRGLQILAAPHGIALRSEDGRPFSWWCPTQRDSRLATMHF